MVRVADYFTLSDLKVRPDQLLLDPSNPRIVFNIGVHHGFSPAEIALPTTQNKILASLNIGANHINILIQSIRTAGFTYRGPKIIVERVLDTSKYIVLEGNRRTAAVKMLLANPDGLSPNVRATLTNLEVLEFNYKSNQLFSKEECVDYLMGASIDPALPWGSLEVAYYIYKSYVRELAKSVHGRRFQYVVDPARSVAELFNKTLLYIRKQIIIYRVFEHLRDAGYEVDPSYYTMIEMAVKDTTLSSQYFELDDYLLYFSANGMSRFDQVCLQEGCAISNPKEFRAFAKIVKDYPKYITLAESAEYAPSVILAYAMRVSGKSAFENKLSKILKLLESLEVVSSVGSGAEKVVGLKIVRIVKEKLWPLLK